MAETFLFMEANWENLKAIGFSIFFCGWFTASRKIRLSTLISIITNHSRVLYHIFMLCTWQHGPFLSPCL